ncbi:hypothetical protein GC093_13885 [Paenibacillus sp. LMG 31456]|uniref:Uncharacterized protein n=1 Tax=Paenibacillus foliorum TaxID=2654974 RepID=A0A972GP34_9BACL|nr:hypothetical protein [Paenibacillus foliorum]NOU94301.1 hypothetical protein [Paenibacillus foliorum]
MNAKVEQTFITTLRNWKSMSGADNADAEEAANAFEASFYIFIDAVREWFHELDPQPQTLEIFLELPLIKDIIDRLPGPLYLNFETEAELILENKHRIDDEKYD